MHYVWPHLRAGRGLKGLQLARPCVRVLLRLLGPVLLRRLLGLLAKGAGPKGTLRGVVPLLSMLGPVLLLRLRVGGARALGRAPGAKQLAEGVCGGVLGLLGSLGGIGSILGKGVVSSRAGVWLGVAAGGNGDGGLLLAVGKAVGGCSRASKGAAAAEGILVAGARGLLGVGATTCAQDMLLGAAAH